MIDSKFVSCICGRKQTTRSHCRKDRSPNYCCLICRPISHNAYIIQTRTNGKDRILAKKPEKGREHKGENEKTKLKEHTSNKGSFNLIIGSL